MAVVLVDSNVLIDVMTMNSPWREWSVNTILKLSRDGYDMAINQIIYCEIAYAVKTVQELEQILAIVESLKLDLPWSAAFPAAQAHKVYRQRGGIKTSPMPDFYIGAHAQVSGLKLLTRDPRRYRTYFPQVELICPG